ncbi:hypothetical protein ANRL1_04688 [Anaerolineae bacterium]|nr:hypothetical protein ANRL1_04688 [Anaerolineae bacterium]
MQNLTAVNAGNTIHLSEITLAEMVATFAAKGRAPRGIHAEEVERVIETFLKDCSETFRLASASRPVINLAVEIARRRKIRGCDAIQLATALTLSNTFKAEELPALIFVACDQELLDAAKEEGLATENPAEHHE